MEARLWTVTVVEPAEMCTGLAAAKQGTGAGDVKGTDCNMQHHAPLDRREWIQFRSGVERRMAVTEDAAASVGDLMWRL